MRDIIIEENFQKKLKENINTDLLFTDIEILEYYQKNNLEYLHIALTYTKEKNIMTYVYNSETQKISLIDKTVYNIDDTSDKEPHIDEYIILELFNYCRNKFYEEQPTYDPKISKIFEIISKNLPVNNEILKLYSFSNNEIQELIDRAILVKTESDIYNISLINELYNYGLKLLSTSRYNKAFRCFQKCYQSNPDNRELCLQLLFTMVKTKHYQDALVIYSHIEKINPEKYSKENLLYLYLLNMLTDCYEQYHELLECFDPDDIIRENRALELTQTEFEIRKAIIINKFKYAFKLLNDKTRVNEKQCISEELLKELLSQTIDKEEYYKKKLTKLINEHKYSEMLLLIKERSKHRYLNSNEMCVQLIVESLILIDETRIIPIPTISNTRYLYDAIKGNNFKLAKNLNEQFLKSNGRNIKHDLLNIALTKINNLILDIELENQIVDESNNQELNTLEYDKIPKELLFAEEIAYYIKSENMSFDSAIKQLGIIPSQISLIKLIYARDYFIEGLDELGNQLLAEVEQNYDQTCEVERFLNEIKNNKNLYKTKNQIHTKQKII